jgi:hypothetical protein
MISFEVTGSTKHLESFLKTASKLDILGVMNSCGKTGVAALASATPVESGRAAHSWSYKTSAKSGVYSITWLNSDVENGFPVAIMLQYGYATGTGGYVQGRDYINPAIKPVFDLIADTVWKAVTSA